MFIGNNQFDVDLSVANTIRHLIFANLYTDMRYIQNLTDIISRHIESLGADFDPNTYTITVNIKKTSIRKTYGARFKHEPNFYYQFISNIFAEFFNTNKDKIIEVLATVYPDPYTVFNQIVTSPLIGNLCHVTCLSDKILVIKL